MEELRHQPIAAWKLDDDTPFTDYSGYARVGTRAGTEIKGLPLTSSAAYSQTFDSTHGGSFNVPNWRLAGSEDRSSSISFSVYVDHPSGIFYLFNDHESWEFTGNKITYNLTLSTGNLPIIYDYEINKRLNVVLNYTTAGVTLFINGEMVAKTDITDAMRPYTISSTSPNWSVFCPAGVSGTMNNLTFYQHALSNEEVTAIHEYNTRHAPEEVPVGFGGQVINVSAEVRTPSMEVVWDTETAWNSGVHQSTVTDGDQLQAQREDDVTLDGKWSNSITFASPIPLTAFNSAYMTWSGKNVDIEVSLDGTTWVSPVYGKSLSLITVGFDPTNKTLLVRANFVAGQDEAYINRITFRAFTGTAAANHVDERDITYTAPACAWDDHEPNEFHNFWGVNLVGTGRLTVSPDPNMTVKTIEFWVKIPSGSTVTLSSNINSPTNYYINGTVSGTLLYDQWEIITYTYTGGITTDFWIQGDLTVGRISVYPAVLSGANIARIQQAYTGYPKTTVSDGAVITIAESATPANIYNHNWADFSAKT